MTFILDKIIFTSKVLIQTTLRLQSLNSQTNNDLQKIYLGTKKLMQ